jgi:RNA polymerase sigma-70 factor, ECF subfamily
VVLFSSSPTLFDIHMTSAKLARVERAKHDGRRDERPEVAVLYREHADIVKRWALRLGGPRIDAEDVVHDVFMVAQRRLAEFRGDAKITTWLYRITERVVHKQLHRQRIGSWLRGLAGDFAARIEEPEHLGPYETVERKHAARLVYKALDRLNPRHRKVVILYELEGLTGEEIAELTNTKLATVWVWLHRGRAKFVSRLRELAAEDGMGS